MMLEMLSEESEAMVKILESKALEKLGSVIELKSAAKNMTTLSAEAVAVVVLATVAAGVETEDDEEDAVEEEEDAVEEEEAAEEEEEAAEEAVEEEEEAVEPQACLRPGFTITLNPMVMCTCILRA